MRILLLVLPLAACSARPADEPADNTATAAIAMQAPAGAPTDRHAVPTPGTLKTFGDWTVGCDNVRTCTLASLGGEGGNFPPVTIAVKRDGGADAMPSIALEPQDDGAHGVPHPVAVAIDGQAFDPANGAAVVAAMANGHALTIRDASGATIATQSLNGASAALRSIDAAQGRAGGVTALVARGPTPASTVPAVPALPVIVAVVPAGSATMPDKTMLAALAKQAAGGSALDDTVTADPEAYALGGGATLVLIPWSQGAYNISKAMFVMHDGKAVAAQTDMPSAFDGHGMLQDAVPSVINAVFEDGVLKSLAKGRGLGDCGDAQSFVWDGVRFRLSAESAMGECRGNPNFITTWRVRVLRR